MAKNWWDSSRLADEEDKWWESSALAEEPRSAGGGRGFINPPMAYEPQPVRPAPAAPTPAPAPDVYYDAMGNLLGGSSLPAGNAPASLSLLDRPDTRDRTQEPGFMLRPEFVEQVRNDFAKLPPEKRRDALIQTASGENGVNQQVALAAQRILAEVRAEDEMLRREGTLRQGMIDLVANAPAGQPAPRKPGSKPAPAPRVTFPDMTPTFADTMDMLPEQERIARTLKRDAATRGVVAADTGVEAIGDRARFEADVEAANRRQFAEQNPLLGSIAAGSAGLISGAINIPSVVADAFNKTAINPVLRALGMQDLPPVPTAFGTEYLAKSASDYMPKVGKQEMDAAIKSDEFAPWLMSKLAANSPQIAQSLLAAFVPPLRAVLLPGIAGTAAGQSFAEGDDSRVALAKGAVEYASEKLPLGVFDKVGDVLKGMSPAKANTVLAVAGQRALQVGGAITANGLTNAIEEVAAQFGGNVLDKYFQGKDIELTKGLAEAGVVGGVTGKLMSAPQVAAAATGYYEPERQIAREIDSVGRAFENLSPEASRAISIDMLRTEAGTSNLISPAATVRNFTPPDSPTKQAGLVDIEVPLPQQKVEDPLTAITPEDAVAKAQARLEELTAIGKDKPDQAVTLDNGIQTTVPGERGRMFTPEEADEYRFLRDNIGKPEKLAERYGSYIGTPLAEINPSTEEQFGLDKLRMGGANVGTTGLPGGLAGEGGAAGGGVTVGGLGAAGPGAAGATGYGSGIAPIPGVNDRSTVLAGGAAGQQLTGVAVGGEPLTWTGRAKTGYATEQDAQQAMATASTVIDTKQTHDWRVEPMGNGRFQIVGYQKETNLGTQTSQAQQAQAQGAAPASQMAGAAQGSAGGIPAATGTPLELSDTERAGLRLAPTAPIRDLKVLNQQVDLAARKAVYDQVLKATNGDKAQANLAAQKQAGITFSPVQLEDFTDSQRLASAVARLMGKTLTVVRQETGAAGMLPNGMINDLGGKHLFLANDADDSPLSIVLHEAIGHGLPEPQRKALGTAMLDLFRQDRKNEFLKEFSYTPEQFNEEVPAMMVQAISKREDFWQELRTKMGNKEFGEVAKVILTKLGDILTGAKKQYGDDFVNKYITDVAKARDLLTTAYADSMKAQGLQPDVQLEAAGQAMASNRSRIGMDFKDVVKRTPELQAAAEMVKAGEMTAVEYDKLVNETKPVEPYTSVPQPAAETDLRTALTSDKVDRIGVPSKTLKVGDPVGLRLDIPAYSNHGTWVVSVHEQESGYNAGKSIGYEPVAAATNVTFGVVEKAAMNIAGGKPKATIAVIKGGWKPTTPAEAKLKADQALKSKDWVQVGMDPERHSYFYDRKTMEPVTAADEVIQIGPLVLAKNPTYGEKSDFMFSNRAKDVNALGMYSELARKLDAGPNQAPADQWKAYIKGLPTKGVKPDEIEWSGVNDFLELKRSAGQKVTKAEVAEYIKQGGVQVEETVLGAGQMPRLPEGWRVESTDDYDGFGSAGFVVRDEDGNEVSAGETEQMAMREAADPDELPGTVDTKYDKYTLPGGENYREVLLTLPIKAEPNDPEPLKIERRDDGAYVLSDKYGPVKTVPTIEEAEAYRDRRSADDTATLMRRREREGKLYRSGHWNQLNVLAHIRVNDRTDADGNRVLFVEELQSDWGQAGAQARKKEVKRLIAQGMSKEDANKAVPQDFGFTSDSDVKPVSKKEYDAYVDKLLDDYIEKAVQAGEDRQAAGRRGINMPFPQMAQELGRSDEYARMRAGRDLDMNGGSDKIPAAPFVTKTEGWLNLALKRVMVMAAEGGYDKVAFVNGEQSAERYDLSKQISKIRYLTGSSTGRDLLVATDKAGNSVLNKPISDPKEVEEYVGKEVANRLLNAKSNGEVYHNDRIYNEQSLSGLDLKVGGEGMKTFYDTIVPTALKKLLPKLGGGQVSQVAINLPNKNSNKYLGDATFDPAQAKIIERGPGVFQVWVDGKLMGNGNFDSRQEAEAFVATGGGSQAIPQTGFDITPAMRERIAGGVPMFSNRVKEEQTGEIAEQAAPKPRRGAERVGDFDVRTMKDGTIMVYGDPEAIRAAIPDDVKGRVTKDGYVFTNAAAPRVKAALEGRKTAYSRGGQVTEKLPMKDGKYLGAPEKYNTPGKIVALRKQLRKLTLEGQRGRYWYENSSRAILRMTGGNVQEARKFVALLAIYSPQARVDSNSTFALRAWAQYKAGQPISVKTGVQDKKATQAMADVDAFWSGEKTGNFFFNLLREIDTSTAGKQGATIDMWMMRAAEYPNDAPTPTQYAFMENETNRIAQEMGWEPQQVQAAIWVAMKARMENKGVKERTEATSEKKGWIKFERDAKGKKVRVIIDAQKHRDNWLKHAMEHVPTKEDTEQAKFDFADGVGRHIGQLSLEARPGRSTGVLDGIHTAPYAQQVEFQQAFQRAFYDENGTDMLAAQLGLLTEPSDIMRPGVWQGEVSPSTQKRVAMAPAGGDAGKTNVDPAQAELLNVYASVAGLVGRQEGVGWHRPFYAGTKGQSNGLDIDIGRALNPVETKDLEAAIGKWMDDKKHANWQNQFALISSPTGIRVVNFGIITNAVLQSDIVKVAEGVLPNFDYRVFASSGDMPTNDWEVNPNGQGYVQRISAAGRSDVLDWARSVLAPRVQRVFEQFAEKYQWGDPGRIQFSRRVVDDGNGGGRGQGAGVANRQVVSQRPEDSGRDTGQDQGRSQDLTPLPGAPKVPGFHGPDPRLVAVAEQYARDNGITLRRQSEYAQVDPVRAKRIANAYEVMRHAPQDPKVKEAYENLIRQTVAQYKALTDAGYRFWFIDTNKPDNADYASTPWNAMRDIRANKQMGVFPTADGFGSGEAIRDNPLETTVMDFTWPSGDLNGPQQPVYANDLFRAVHDAFGHGLEGAGFRAQGEENAWQAHVRLFTGSAVGAITSETRGQNSWLNYGPYGEKNRTAKVEDTEFATQKAGLMPEWTWNEGRVTDEPVFRELDPRRDAEAFRSAVDRVKRGRPYSFPLHVHDVETYRGARLFLSEDGESGFALIGDEIGSFFSGGKGQAYPTLRLAVAEGGRRIDAYRTRMPSVLGRAGFRPVARVEFNPEFATDIWDYEKFRQFQGGRPDLVFFAYDSTFLGGDGDAEAAKTPLVDYERALELQAAAVARETSKPSPSPQGGEGSPAFNQRARAEDKEVAGLFRDLQDARGLKRVRALERVDAHPMAETIRRIDQEFMDILERLDDAGLVKINCK